jgi:predicted AAA+ superfamily ATPase
MSLFKRQVGFPENDSFFLFGPRGTGKSHLLHSQFPEAPIFDLLDTDLQFRLLAKPSLLESLIPPDAGKKKQPIILDEIQKVPALLDEVHRLIEKKKFRFVLTGSSARKLRRSGTNLLAGRAQTCSMHPFTSLELGKEFSLSRALTYGMLPKAYLEKNNSYLASYVGTYLKEEVLQEGLTRNLEGFSRFLQAAAFSQASVLNRIKVAEDAAIGRRAAEGYFEVLKDLLLSVELPVFSKRAKRTLIRHRKFYFFDTGVFRSIRPMGVLDSEEDLKGAAFETLVLQELRALNNAHEWGAEIFFWRTQLKQEVDFVLYGPQIFTAIEVKSSSRLRPEDFAGLKLFGEDYPQAKRILIHGGTRKEFVNGIQIIPAEDWFALPASKRLG